MPERLRTELRLCLLNTPFIIPQVIRIMTNSGLDPIQSWLWSVLDDLGIDGVIYSRHVLDLLISSKHSFDHRLDEKEQSIFSKIAPSTNKKKRKCSRRSSSFSSLEEMLWKKEIAVSCLMSAAETKTDCQETESTIQQVVDELYSKLSKLNLTSDGKKASSDGECPVFVGEKIGVQRKKRNKENYEDAFPSLAGSKYLPVPTNPFLDSVWSKPEIGNTKSARDSDNSTMKISDDSSQAPLVLNKSQRNRKEFGYSVRRVRARADTKGSSRNAPKHLPFGIHPRYPRKLSSTKEFKTTPKRSEAEKKSPNRGASKPAAQPRNRARIQLKFDTVGNPQKNSCGRGRRNRKRNANSTQNKNSVDDQKQSSMAIPCDDYCGTQYYCSNDFHLHYAHLPSWMETTLIDISHRTCILSKCKMGDVEESSDESVYGDEIHQPGMPFSKRWYRDQESGLLTYRPLRLTDDKKDSSSSESSLSRSSSSEGDDQEILLQGKSSTSEISTASEEIWMWCPSPSLWEDGTRSPVSRLESVYKKELLSFGTEKHADSLSGRMWEEYQPIFQELNDLISTDDQESSGANNPSSGWLFRDDLDDCDPTLSSTLSEQPLHERFESEYGHVGNEFGLWKEQDSDQVAAPNCGFDNNAADCSDGKPQSLFVSSDRNIWKYSPKSSVWPSKRCIRSESHHRDELSDMMWKGVFGIHCDQTDDNWSMSLKEESGVWGGGIVPGIEHPDTSEKDDDEKTMNTLVDALFGDLGFDLLTMLSSQHSNTMPDRSSSNFDLDFSPSMAFGFPSFLFESPIERFHSSNNDLWRPKLDMDNLWGGSSLASLNPFATIDDVLRSISAEESECSLDWTKDCHKTQTVLDSVTENQAWKTSLRIGNSWQNISGIRPVNVIYSENKLGPQSDDTLVPSSNTHFRPISTSVGSSTPDCDATPTMEMPYNISENGNLETGFTAIQNETTATEHVNPTKLEDLTIQTKFCKLSQDKSMQTSFELAVQHDMPICQQFVLPRPPKANSR